VESTVELDDEQESSSRYIWLDDKTARSQENMLKEKAAASLDVLAAYLVSVITRQFFTELVLEDRTIFLKNNHYPLSVPRFVTRGGTVKAYAERQYSEIADLGEFLSRVAALPAQRHDWLKPIARSYFELLGEEDQWKQFLWSFLTLEMLTSKLWENFYKKIKTNLGLLSLASNDGKVEPEIQEAIPYLLTPDDPNRVPLMKKFAIVALSLTPSTAATDIAAFKRLKEVRDNLAHGVLTNEHQLPVSESRILLDRYVRLAVSAKLDDVN
jgi:hypothetical protein